jgi:hypothetical protein
VAQRYPLALGSLSVASYDSQGYGGSILSRLHTGIHICLVTFRYIYMVIIKIIDAANLLRKKVSLSLGKKRKPPPLSLVSFFILSVIHMVALLKASVCDVNFGSAIFQYG